MVFNCFLRAFILVLVILFYFLGIFGGLKYGLWLSPHKLVEWLSANTDSMCLKFIIFHPPQKKLQQVSMLKKNSAKYLGGGGFCLRETLHTTKGGGGQ